MLLTPSTSNDDTGSYSTFSYVDMNNWNHNGQVPYYQPAWYRGYGSLPPPAPSSIPPPPPAQSGSTWQGHPPIVSTQPAPSSLPLPPDQSGVKWAGPPTPPAPSSLAQGDVAWSGNPPIVSTPPSGGKSPPPAPTPAPTPTSFSKHPPLGPAAVQCTDSYQCQMGCPQTYQTENSNDELKKIYSEAGKGVKKLQVKLRKLPVSSISGQGIAKKRISKKNSSIKAFVLTNFESMEKANQEMMATFKNAILQHIDE